MWGIVTIVLLSGASALLWLSYGFMASYRMFGPSALPPLIHAAAAISTAVLAVIVIGQATLRFGFARLLRTDPTDLQRSLIFAALSFISVALVLAHFGFDPTTILTTSAIVTAIIGLSIQPMLGSLLSGLNVARVVRIGDGVLVDGQQVEVVSLNWRSVIGRHADGGSVVLPNAQLANGSLVILPRDRSARAEITLEVPAGVPPHRLRKLVGSIVKEFPEVDPVKPVLVRPTAYEPSKPLSRYSVTFWVRHYGQRGYAENGVLERIWYVFQRENIISHDVGGEPAHVERPELSSAGDGVADRGRERCRRGATRRATGARNRSWRTPQLWRRRTDRVSLAPCRPCWAAGGRRAKRRCRPARRISKPRRMA